MRPENNHTWKPSQTGEIPPTPDYVCYGHEAAKSTQ